MASSGMQDERQPDDEAQPAEDAEAALRALLGDLEELSAYLTQRGRHTYELAQRFLENARRDSASRAYDERQATMLDYQHYIWIEIAGRVDKLLTRYGRTTEDDGDEPGAGS